MEKRGQLPRSEKFSDLFSQEDYAAIRAAVQQAEKNTSGEIRVKIRQDYTHGLDGNLDAQALRDFVKEGLRATRDKTGVLVVVLMDARRFKILADEGIHSKLPQEYWDAKADVLAGAFREGNYVLGICEIVADIGSNLARFFPKRSDDVNELPDEVIVEESGK